MGNKTAFWIVAAGCLVSSNAFATVIDDFESGLPLGSDGNGTPIGFYTFTDGSPVSIATSTAPPLPVPGESAGNTVLEWTGDIGGFGGFLHSFENPSVDTWTPQDWSAHDSFSVFMFGQNTGTSLFIDILDNRNPGSTSDDAERFTFSFVDDFSGWSQIVVPFTDLIRKEIGNGAPNDGLSLTSVHGWGFGTLGTPGEVTYYLDNFELNALSTTDPEPGTVSEPGALVILGLGLVGMGVLRRRGNPT